MISGSVDRERRRSSLISRCLTSRSCVRWCVRSSPPPPPNFRTCSVGRLTSDSPHGIFFLCLQGLFDPKVFKIEEKVAGERQGQRAEDDGEVGLSLDPPVSCPSRCFSLDCLS